MRIIDIRVNRKLQLRPQKFKFLIAGFCFIFLLAPLLSGCVQKTSLEQAETDSRISQEYYQRAVRLYQDLIAKSKDAKRLHLELGRLYYTHGEFLQAIEEFKKTDTEEAAKLLAISYYRLGNFTDALGVFSSREIPDDEYRYYYGLTCEKLNLFDQALEIYRKIKTKGFSAPAAERINLIEKQVRVSSIKDLSPQTARILLGAPDAQAYPQAGALILYCDEKSQVSQEGSETTYLHYIIKILNERGKEDFSETHIDYDSTYEKVELEYARTIKPDGSVLEVGLRNIRDVSKYLNFPLYSNARVYIISFPGISEGASIEYKVKVYRNQLINKKDLAFSYPLQAQEPIISANFSVDLPKERPLHIKTVNQHYNNFGANLEPLVKDMDGRRIYSWSFKDIPQVIPESNMPAQVEINPTILISTFGSWQEVYTWWQALARDKITADAAIKDKVRELISRQDSPEGKVRAIYNFCAQKIRYVAVEYGQAGYEPHFAYDIFKNKYGDCKDQAILLVAMLREAGFSAWPVLIPTRECYNLNADFPSVLFNHCIASVALKDKVVFLDPTAETCSFGDLPADDQAREVLVVREEGYQIQSTPLYASDHNLVRQYLNMKVSPDETMAADKVVFTHGMYEQAQRFWLLYTPPELIGETLKEKIQEISIGGTLEKYKVKNAQDLNVQLELVYTFKGPEYFTAAGGLRIMPQLASLDTTVVAKDKRKYPVDFIILDTKENIFEIEIPKNFVVKYMPQSITEDSPWLRFTVEYNRKSNRIYFRQKAELKRRMVGTEEYPVFKEFFEGLAKKIKQRIILEKIG